MTNIQQPLDQSGDGPRDQDKAKKDRVGHKATGKKTQVVDMLTTRPITPPSTCNRKTMKTHMPSM